VKLVIDGREYDGTAQPFIGDLRLLRREFGFGFGTVIERMQKLSADTDALALLDDEEFTEALVAWMWMLRLRAGERTLTRADVELTALDQIQIIDDEPEDGAVEADPTPASEPMDSDRAGADVAAAGETRGSTKTSSRRSTRGSR
jgi:hypothetical protein